MRSGAAGLALALAFLAGNVLAQGRGPESVAVATLPPIGPHWVWVPDRLLAHSILFDGDTGEALGMVDGGTTLTPRPPLFSRVRGEIYSVDTAYSRARRGERIDYVSIYDATTTDFVAEVRIPTESSEMNAAVALVALLDGDRFLASFNQFPRTSISIVDLASRTFVGEVAIAGCAGIYPVGPRSFATLCGDGTALAVELDEAGRRLREARSPVFFDTIDDPVFMAAGRSGTSWIFVTYRGQVTQVEFDGEAPTAAAPWSLVSEAEARDGWRPGGLQHVAVHRASGRLFTLMHRGKPGSHKAGGPEIWVFEIASHERVARFEVPNVDAVFLGGLMQLDPESFAQRLLGWVIPGSGAHVIAVTQDDHPLLFARNAQLGAVAVLDARSGEPLRFLREAGLAGPNLEVP